MANKEKVVDLKPKAEKISEEHLKELQKIVNNINGIQFNIGKMEVNKFNAMRELGKSQNEVSEMQDVLLKEYGNYDVNIEDGTIKYPKDNGEVKKKD